MTPFKYRQVISISRAALVTSFTTGNLFIVLPLIAEKVKELLASDENHSQDNEELPEVIIPAGPLQPPFRASNLFPLDGAVDVTQAPILTWNAGEAAASHDVYFGTDADAVKNADASSPEYKGSKSLGSENHDPGQTGQSGFLLYMPKV